MKKRTRLLAFILAMVLLLGMFSGCASNKKADANMTKGEFMLLFVSEIGLAPSANPKVELTLESDNKYRDAAVALVEIGYLTAEEAQSNLDKPVTKEFVACLCVENLYFRQTFDVALKDEGKLSDPQACRDAVGHGIVEADNGYFVAYDKMTYSACQKAIDTMLKIDATATFTGKGEVEVALKEDVLDITEEFDDNSLVVIDPSDPAFDEIVAGMTTTQQVSYTQQTQSSYGVYLMADKTQQGQTVIPLVNSNNYCSYDDADTGDVIVIRIPRNSMESRKFKVGDFLVYGLWAQDAYNAEVIKKQSYTFCGEIIAINEPSKDFFYIYYSVRIASEEEVMDSAKLNEYNTEANGVPWKAEQLSSSAGNGIKIGGFETTDSGFKLTVEHTATNPVDSWRDAQFSIDMKYTFEVKDIALQIDGFGNVLSGNIENAICRLDYTVVNTFDASTSMRVSPDNNRNGKFLNNASRSRLTGATAAGATEIKVARLYAELGYGFNVEMYVYVTIEIDGSISLRIENTYGRGFKIENNKVIPIYDKETFTSEELNVNVEAGIHFDFSLRWIRRKGTPWADLDFEIGLGIDATAKVFMLTEDHATCNSVMRGYPSTDELRRMQEYADIEYCFDCRMYAYYEISGLNKDTRIGKVIRWFDEDFDLSKREEWTFLKYHREGGTTVSSCSRQYEGYEETQPETTKEETFGLEKYKVVLPEYTCGNVDIISYPVKGDAIELMGGIRVYVMDPSVATVRIYGNSIVIEAVGVGSTELVIETSNKRFMQECSITITENSN